MIDYDSDSDPDDISYGSMKSDGEDDEVRKLQKLARKETLHVRAWRRTVVWVLLLVSSIVIACTYVFLRSKERVSFEESFRLMAVTTEEALSFEIRGTVGAIKEFGEVLTSHSLNSQLQDGVSWPAVTLPNFEAYVSHARIQTQSDLVVFTPIVKPDDLSSWNNYSVANQGWIAEGHAYIGDPDHIVESIPPEIYNITHHDDGDEHHEDDNHEDGRRRVESDGHDDEGHGHDEDQAGEVVIATCTGEFPCSPIWQTSPPPDVSESVNQDMLTNSEAHGMYRFLNAERDIVFGAANGEVTGSLRFIPDTHDLDRRRWLSEEDHSDGDKDTRHPHSTFAYPIFDSLPEDPAFNTSSVVGIAWGLIPWDLYLRGLLQDGIPGIYAVVKNSCGQKFTYWLEGMSAEYIGEGDLHDAEFDELKVDIQISDTFLANQRYGGSLLCIILTFFVYDAFVRKKDNLLIQAAARSNKLISSLFPSNVRDRILPKFRGDDDEESVANTVTSTHRNLRDFMNGAAIDSEGDAEDFMYKTKPIADLFPETTIVFADLVGFTAWSSVREPSQVFTLLETIYGAFDAIAKKRRVFKVETIGDCYVAVTGLPEPRKDHALSMARFSMDCMKKMSELTKNLETTLGPDTADLNMRFGLHSGPVTAGVLRGDRARFQLFGDTMNMASTMESNGQPGRIHLSQETADQLGESGKRHWVKKREDLVTTKGKGELQTYWLVSTSGGSGSGPSDKSDSIFDTMNELAMDDWDDHGVLEDENVLKLLNEKTERLVNWNVEVLSAPLKQIASRRASGKQSHKISGEKLRLPSKDFGDNTLDEVKEIIALPKFDPKAATAEADLENTQLDPEAISQLREYVQTVATLYHDNAFHNFEHASHVTMSTVKLLSRIVSSPDVPESPQNFTASILHENSYGINSDPLTQFACIFSALIHDVDHGGVSNSQLVKENSHISALYRGKSVAEQNSVDLAWELLFSDCFGRLRAAIYDNESELKRFRQLVVNSVMATDIFDRDLKALRNGRWERAFSDRNQSRESQQDTVNRKATIVIEHLIQASDVSHTMQHWHVYRKWNECLFREQVFAFVEGRGEKDPALHWYEGEIGFFDHYIIPLAKKLKECGVFGVSSDEYLNYALKNRSEWEAKGKEIVAEMVAELGETK